jgi:hypothetical protein
VLFRLIPEEDALGTGPETSGKAAQLVRAHLRHKGSVATVLGSYGDPPNQGCCG